MKLTYDNVQEMISDAKSQKAVLMVDSTFLVCEEDSLIFTHYKSVKSAHRVTYELINITG